MKSKFISMETAGKESKAQPFSSPMDLIRVALGEIQKKALEMPAEDFFEHLDEFVENSKRFIESFDDDETRGRLREVYRGIVRYAIECKIKASGTKWN